MAEDIASMIVPSNYYRARSKNDTASPGRQPAQGVIGTPQPPGDGLSRAFDKYMLHCKSHNLAKATLRDYKQKVLQLLNHCREQGVVELGDITPDMIRAFMAVRLDRGLSGHSNKSGHAAHRAFFNYCVNEGLLDKSPMANIDTPKVDFEPRPPIGVADLKRLNAACTSARDRALLLFLVETGLRAGEALRLVGADVDLVAMEVVVHKSKARKARMAHFSVKTQQALAHYYHHCGTPRADEAVWRTETSGTPLTYAGLRQIFRRLSLRAGVARSNPHALRSTFAVLAHCKGMENKELQDLMGHSSAEMLKHYLSLHNEHLKQVYHQFGPLGGLDLDLSDLGQGQD